MKNTALEDSQIQKNNTLNATLTPSQLVYWSMLDPSIHAPDAIVMDLVKLLKSGSTVFEFWAGRWRNAIPLSKSGMRVSVQDMWEAAMKDLQESAQKNNYSITTETSLAQEHKLSELFDACVCIRLLHFLSRADARKVIQTMQDHTKSWGWNMLSFFTDETMHSKEYFFPSLEEMKNVYIDEGWQVHMVWEKTASTPWSGSGRIMYQQKLLVHKLMMTT